MKTHEASLYLEAMLFGPHTGARLSLLPSGFFPHFGLVAHISESLCKGHLLTSTLCPIVLLLALEFKGEESYFLFPCRIQEL